MKITIKQTYLFLLSAIALASCSQQDMPGGPDAGDSQIVFRTSLPEVVSRAQIINKQSMPYFYVTGFDFNDNTRVENGVMEPLFDNEIINVSPEEEEFISPYCCWPDKSKTDDVVSFLAFYPGPSDISGAQLVNTSTASALNYTLTGFSVNKEIAGQVDFVTAYTTGTRTENLVPGVHLNFLHQLSRIEIKACGANASADIEIAGVRIGGVGVGDSFDFKLSEKTGEWSGNPTLGVVEYIYDQGDKILTCGRNHPVDIDDAFSIMGNPLDEKNDNCAMLIPGTYTQWNYVNDSKNNANGMYISVLLRVTDASPTAGVSPVETQRYPYRDLSQGADALDIPREYLAVKKESNKVSCRLFLDNGVYYTNQSCTEAYTHPEDEEIKEFSWASVPVSGNWEAGKIYTYTLDYSYGVGVHDPETTTSSPAAGDPIFSDHVPYNVTVRKWSDPINSGWIVPGS